LTIQGGLTPAGKQDKLENPQISIIYYNGKK
jgi:hypothetical protein